MTIRYLAIAGSTAERRDVLARRCHDVTGLAINRVGHAMVLASRQRSLAPDGPLIIGDLFDGHEQAVEQGGPRPVSVDVLLHRYWGRYIAIWCDLPNGLRLLRDPSGALPCYYQSAAGLVLIASDMALLDLALSGSRALNWPEIARILGAGDLRSPQTGFVGLRELPPGHVLSNEGHGLTERQAWDPWRYVAGDGPASFDDHAALLRGRVDMVITALGRAYPEAVATVSGGLDSTVVALALAPVASSLTCVTAATRDPSGDERRYARLVAEAASAAYLEHFLDPSQVDLRRSQMEHLPRPVGRPFFQAVTSMVAAAAQRRGACAIFNGTGGDNVFCFLQSVTPVVDRLRAGSLHGGLRTLADVARLTTSSFAQVAIATGRRLLAHPPSRWRDDRRFLSDAQADQAGSFEHPWLARRRGARPGQLAHLAMLLRVQNYLDPWQPDASVEIVNPLLAQPIVECCLGVPSWQWCRGGVDRAVVRRAFADLIPASIATRRWKGGPDGFIGTLVDRHRPLLRDRLIGGVLADHCLLDRSAIAAVIDDPRPPTASDALRLLALADAEAWVRHHG